MKGFALRTAQITKEYKIRPKNGNTNGEIIF